MADNTPPMDEVDTVDIRPWPLIEIVGRTVVLASVARRGILEVDGQRDLFDRETDRFDLHTWARTELQNWIEDRELALLAKPVGELDDDDLGACDDALVGASTLGWVISVVQCDHLPLPQDGVAEERVLQWAPEPWGKVRQLVTSARLRSEEALAGERERWELWYWRATERPLAPGELQEVVDEVRSAGLIPIVDNDFATDDGRPFSRLDEHEQDDAAWLAELRLRALNWACGLADSWESAPLYPD